MAYQHPTAGAARESLGSATGLGGITADADEVNKLDGLSATKAQLDQSAVPSVVTATGDITLSSTQNRAWVTNENGTTSVRTVTLPAAAAGLEYTFLCRSTVQFIVKPNGADKIGIPTSGALGTSGLSIAATVAGNSVRLAAFVAGAWQPIGSAGTTGWATT